VQSVKYLSASQVKVDDRLIKTGVSAIRCLTKCTIKHGLPLQPELRASLLATFRDGAIDMTFKLAVVDEVLRLIITQACPEEDVPTS
jgi:hypothetical protein